MATRHDGEQQEISCGTHCSNTSNANISGNQVTSGVNNGVATAFDENFLDPMMQGKHSINKPRRHSY